jgi:hypothetical protein
VCECVVGRVDDAVPVVSTEVASQRPRVVWSDLDAKLVVHSWPCLARSTVVGPLNVFVD